MREELPRPDFNKLADRAELLVSAAEEEDDTDPVSLFSLRNLMSFLRSEPQLGTPSIVVTPSGNFRAEWRAGKNRHFAVEFLPSGSCRYVVFAPDPKDTKRTIRTSGIAHCESLLTVLEPLNVYRWAI